MRCYRLLYPAVCQLELVRTLQHMGMWEASDRLNKGLEDFISFVLLHHKSCLLLLNMKPIILNWKMQLQLRMQQLMLFMNRMQTNFQTKLQYHCNCFENEQKSSCIVAGSWRRNECILKILFSSLVINSSPAAVITCLAFPYQNWSWTGLSKPMTLPAFPLLPFEDDLIVHGEVSISRIDTSGHIVWQFTGHDIFSVTWWNEYIRHVPWFYWVNRFQRTSLSAWLQRSTNPGNRLLFIHHSSYHLFLINFITEF